MRNGRGSKVWQVSPANWAVGSALMLGHERRRHSRPRHAPPHDGLHGAPRAGVFELMARLRVVRAEDIHTVAASLIAMLRRETAGIRHRLGPAPRTPSERVWTDDFPVVALAELVALVVVNRAVAQELLDVAASCGRGVHEQDAAGFAAGALPGMRDVAREERAGAGPADGDLVADLEGDLAGEHPGD